MLPFIRWAGSKRQLLPTLSEYWPGDKRKYIEPFCGSSCLFFSIEPSRAVLGDLNSELITTYRAVKNDPTRVFECLKRIPVSKTSYYKIRAKDPAALSDIEQAARFLFLNRLCFNGIYRTNSAGKFNVPYRAPDRKVTFHLETLLEASKVLKRATFVNGDFEETISKAESGDFVYLDPPYAVSSRKIFSQYHPETFSIIDIPRLRSVLLDMDRRGIGFVVSYAQSAEARILLKGWDVRKVKTRRNVAGFAGARKAAYEYMASNMELAQ